MSAFLGPIHAKMYSRVLYQDSMAEALLTFAEEQGWADGLRQKADSKAPAAVNAPLENLIDPANIHGWLSQAVSVCERRFALIAGGILAGHPERMEALQGILRDMGRKSGVVALRDSEMAFTAIHDILLDGMPCDFPFNITQSQPKAAVWQVAACPHTPYWEDTQQGAEAYYLLRDAWIQGALEGSGIAYARTGADHTLRREL